MMLHVCLYLFVAVLAVVSTTNLSDKIVFADTEILSAFPTAFASNISEQCILHTREYLAAVRDRHPWAIQMYESSGRLEENLLFTGSGNIHHESGLFDECLSVQSIDTALRVQYCTVFFDLKPIEDLVEGISGKEDEPDEHGTNFQMSSVSFCIPSSCSARDLRSAVAQRVGSRIANGRDHTIVAISNDDYCFTEEKVNINNIKLDNIALMTMAMFSLLLLFVIVATVHGAWRENWCRQPVDSNRDRLGTRILNCFSAINNGSKLISTEEDVKESLSCLHGIRVLNTCWIVLLHMILEIPLRYGYRYKQMTKEASRWEFQLFLNGTVAVDTFFFISGLLIAYSQLNQLAHNQGFFDVKRFYFHRYFRIIPLYAFILAFVATLFPYIGTGPDWNYIQRTSRAVRKNWWTYVLFVSNRVPQFENVINNPSMGLGEGWYLSCDMQMFWISPMIIYPLWKWKRGGLFLAIITLCGFLGASITVFVVHPDLLPTMLLTSPSNIAGLNDYFKIYYYQTYTRIPPYLIGIILGWSLYQTKDRKITINRYIATIGWATTILTLLAVLFGMVPYLSEDQVPIINPVVRIFYGALHRSVWAAALGWVVFSCTTGHGGFIHRFLSSKFFLPLSRLSYAVYLIHFNYIRVFSSSMRKPLYFNEFHFLVTFFGGMVIIFALAIFVSIAVEMPFRNLDKFLFPSVNSNSCKTSKLRVSDGVINKDD